MNSQMEKDELRRKLETLERPEFSSETHKQQLKLTLLNARRTARWGTLLIIIPSLFLLAVFLKYGFGLGLFFYTLDRLIFEPIRQSKYKFLEPLLLFIVPLIALVINLIGITHFSIQKGDSEIEINISVKKRWWNWVVIAISATIVSVIFLYAIKGDL